MYSTSHRNQGFLECVVIFPSLTNLPSFNHHPSFLMPGHSLCDSDGLQHQTSRPLGRPSLVADHLYRSSLSSPDPRTNPSPVRHISDWTPPPLHWPLWFVYDSCLHPISLVRSYDFGPLRVVSGGLFVGPFFLVIWPPWFWLMWGVVWLVLP